MIEQKAETAFSILMAGFVVFLVLTNIIGVKLFLAFPEWLPNGFFGEPITLTTGILTYPITFLVTDIVCEVYGRRRANIMVFTGFVMSLLSLVLSDRLPLPYPARLCGPPAIRIMRRWRRCNRPTIPSSRYRAF